jgi:hypothetical protein
MIAGVEEIFGLMTVVGCGIFFVFFFLNFRGCLFIKKVWFILLRFDHDVLMLLIRESDGMLNLRKWACVLYHLFRSSGISSVL